MKYLGKTVLLSFSVMALYFISVADNSFADPVGRDPFAFGSIQNARLIPDSFFNLQAVIISGEKKTALINGRRYKVGDQVVGKTIIDIELTHVVTKKNGLTTIYRLGGRGE